MDGNRRFAKRLMLQPWRGHELGAKKIEALIGWTRAAGARELTLYAFSLENFNRPRREFGFLVRLFTSELSSLLRPAELAKLKRRGIRIRFVGEVERFPPELVAIMRKLEEKTKGNKKLITNFAMAYSGRAEIAAAAKRLASAGHPITESAISECLQQSSVQSDPDLVIRTSESRLSGFLLWQAAYSEIIFLPDVLWPEFSKKHFDECLEEYARRQRRFGR